MSILLVRPKSLGSARGFPCTTDWEVMISAMSKIIFLDTNIFLHYQFFDQIDWLKVVKAKAVTIIIPPVTVRELNKHKDSHHRPRVRKRAGAVIKKLSALSESGPRARLRDGVEAWFEDRDPTIDFATYQLSREVQDDNLIASILMCRDENPDVEIILVTSDAGLALSVKARRQEFSATKLADDLKLPDEPDPDQQRIKELERELRERDLIMPDLSLTFQDGSKKATFVLSPPVELRSEESEQRLEEIKKRYPKMSRQPKRTTTEKGHSSSSLSGLLAGLDLSPFSTTISNEEVSKYNRKLDQFYEAYGAHLRNARQFENLKRKTIRLVIRLANNGTAPAEDIDVFMHFPDGFNLVSADKFPKPPEPPDPPPEPKTEMAKLLGSVQAPAYVPYFVRDLARYESLPDLAPPNVSAPDIKRINSFQVDVHVQRVKHNLYETLRTLCVVFESYGSAQSFKIGYRILAADLPHEVKGNLHVVIEKGKM